MRSPSPDFTQQQAQKWILASAVVLAVIYGFRRLVETAAPSQPSGPISSLIGTGAPPPAMQWAVSYAVAMFGLSLLALAAPEVAGGLAMMTVAGALLTNGTAVSRDVAALKGKPVGSSAPTPIPAGTGAYVPQGFAGKVAG